MARRSRAREVALQLLYESDRNPAAPGERDQAFVESRLRGADLRQFALQLVARVRDNRPAIDRFIADAAENWSLSRMTPIDRSILRLATSEILFADTPPRVAIDEAIELSKRFGTADSPRFVNGILDRIITEHPRPATGDGGAQSTPQLPGPPGETPSRTA